jgi:hypothetical protein
VHRRIRNPGAIRPAWDTPHRKQLVGAALDLQTAYRRNSPGARNLEKALVHWLRRAGLESLIEWEPGTCPTCGCGSPEQEIEDDTEHRQRMESVQRLLDDEARKAGCK